MSEQRTHELLAAALQAIDPSLNVVTPNDPQPDDQTGKGDIEVISKNLLEKCRVTSQSSQSSGGSKTEPTKRRTQGGRFQKLFVTNLTGRIYTLDCYSDDTVQIVKAMIEEKDSIPLDQQRLIHGGRQLEDKKTLSDYNIKDESTVHLILRMRGGGFSFAITSELFDTKFHYDFTSIDDSGKKFERGGRTYKRPCGWERYAFKVLGKYENDDWLGANKTRPNEYSSVDGEWPVSYHGTTRNNGLGIAEEGYDLSKSVRQRYGPGIYSTPDVNVAASYAKTFKHKEIDYEVMLQNRVKPGTFNIISKEVTEDGEYWVSPNQDDVRVYAICIRKKSALPPQPSSVPQQQTSSCTIL